MERTFVILVLIDIVNSTKFTEKVGDVRAAEVMRSYDKIFRGLLIKYQGIEIDKTDGALLLFENMKDALNYVSEYHRLVEKYLKLQSRAGIHCGHVMMRENAKAYVARGAKPVEVDGLQKSVAARIMSLANPGQTILSKRAGEYAASVRGEQTMRNLGLWRLKGVQAPMQLYAISTDPRRLRNPKQTDKVRLVRPPKLTPKERLRKIANVMILWPLLFVGVYWVVTVLAFMENSGQLGTNLFYPLYWAVQSLFQALQSISWSYPDALP